MVDLGRGLRNALAKITGAAIVDEKAVKELVKELQRVLISHDVNVKLVFEMTKNIQKRALDAEAIKGLSTREHVVKVVYDELANLMGEKHEPQLEKQKILLCGLYGSGKTTTCGKIVHYFKSKGLSCSIVCADVDRPAAYEQVEQIARQVGAPFYGMKGEKDATKIVKDAMKKAKEDVIIVDTSGRSGLDDSLVGELKSINEVFQPDEKYLVLTADIGQVAGRQAEAFNNAIGITGVIITRMDGSGKGGGALTAIAKTDAKASFIGAGEKMDDFEVFDAQRYVGRLLGFPDLEALMEKVKSISEEQKMPDLEEKLTLKTFYEQLKAAKQLGPMKKVMSMMGMSDLPEDAVNQSEDKLKKFEVIISSMTEEERENASLIKKNRSRMERIATGSGCKPDEVRELISQFEKVEKMMNSFKKNRGLRKKLEKMMKKGGGMPGGMNLPAGMDGAT